MTKSPIETTTQRKTFYGRLPFYYGWVILIAGAIGVIASIPGQTMGVSVFTDHLIQALGITRVGISSAYMAGTLLSAAIIPYAGKLFDKIGARPTAALSAGTLGLFLFLLAFSGKFAALLTSVGLPILPVGIGIAVFGFFGIRLFGQGVLTLASRGMVVRWFSSRRGFAAGILGIVTSFGFSYAPRPLQFIINRFGWSGALMVLGGFVILIFIPFVMLFFRNDPSSIGLEIEEGLPLKKQKRQSGHEAKRDYTVSEARRDFRYWVVILLLSFWALFNTGFTFHVISIFAQVGTDAETALKIFLPISIISVACRFIGSWLSDRIDFKYIVISQSIIMALSGLSLQYLNTGNLGYYTLILSMGITGGLFGVLNMISWPKLFGLQHVGAISGYAMAFVVAGSAIGPWLFSLSLQHTNSYSAVGLFSALFCLLLLIITLISRFTSKVAD